jgi:lipoyl synthase
MANKGNSPEYVQTSLAAALSLGLKKGSFKEHVFLSGLNLLLTYGTACAGKCAYCGITASKKEKKSTFIRVKWPVYKLDDILEACRRVPNKFERVCISMVTNAKALDDTLCILEKIKTCLDLPVSILLAPTIIGTKQYLKDLKEAGADKAGIAIDTATKGLFEKYRGKNVAGPHQWEKYWEVLQDAIDVFGPYHAGIHLICGLGESEKEMVSCIEKAHRMGAKTHLFSFFAEPDTLLEDLGQPALSSYRKIQIARYLINEKNRDSTALHFDEKGDITGFDHDIGSLIDEGYAFMTSGCEGKNPHYAACNRPLANERPSQPFRNYPYTPKAADKKTIREQVKSIAIPL